MIPKDLSTAHCMEERRRNGVEKKIDKEVKLSYII